MLTRSLKSVRSIRSLTSTDGDDAISQGSSSTDIPSYLFERLLPYVCKKFSCDFDLFIKKDSARDGFERYKKVESPVKYKRIGMITPSSFQRPKVVDETGAPDGAAEDDPNFVTVTALYNSNNSLVEIFFYNQIRVPRMLMQVIAIIAPIYEEVNKITIRNCNIDMYTVYELNKLITLMYLTDVCLDDSFVSEANYAILLEKESTLRQLSLCRCYITDVVCQQIVSKLCFPAPAEKNLLILNLSGNHISDEGAKHIGEMLRSNRRLRYLNLAGNRIGDDGVRPMLDALVEFPLTYDELSEKRRRLLTYLKRKHELTRKFMTESQIQVSRNYLAMTSTSARSVTNNKMPSLRSFKQQRSRDRIASAESNLQNKEARQRAEMLAVQFIGQLQGPFSTSNTVLKDGWCHCTGNLTLSYLNLSYNNLSYFTVKKILDVLLYQSCNAAGLFKIILDGNCTPKVCPEYVDISALLNKKLNVHVVKDVTNRRKSCVRTSRVSKISTSGISKRREKET